MFFQFCLTEIRSKVGPLSLFPAELFLFAFLWSRRLKILTLTLCKHYSLHFVWFTLGCSSLRIVPLFSTAWFIHLSNLTYLGLSSKKSIKKMIYPYLTSCLDYSNSLYVGIDQSSICFLQLVKNVALSTLTGKKKRGNMTFVLSSLHSLPVRNRIDFKILLLTFKSLNRLAPPYLVKLLLFYTPSKEPRLSSVFPECAWNEL